MEASSVQNLVTFLLRFLLRYGSSIVAQSGSRSRFTSNVPPGPDPSNAKTLHKVNVAMSLMKRGLLAPLPLVNLDQNPEEIKDVISAYR